MKYYIFCSDITREGWYEEFDTLEQAKNYLKENYRDCEILIKGQEIQYEITNKTIKIKN